MSENMNTVHLIDCMEFMKGIPNKYYELAIVDPPYGIGMSGGNVGYKGFNNLERKEWDNEIPTDEYFNEIKRISINQIIWGGNYFKVLWPTRCYIVWDKGRGFEGRTYAESELAYTSFDANAKTFHHDPLARGSYRGKIHPTQKPVELYKWLLKNYAKPNDKIFDSHVGSGSIRIACHDMGFDFEGCEIDKDYWEAQEDRYKNHAMQGDLFSPRQIFVQSVQVEL